ncbi:MAG TPA: hypothetical protein VFR97_13225 [Capillimicrobium sp.]|nr:hypothetical protein [Capillimicrobium sp.]
MSTRVLSALDLDEIAANKQTAADEYKKAVSAIFLEFARQADLLDEDDKIDTKVVDGRIYDEMKSKRVSKISPPDDDDHRWYPETSSTKAELTAAVFTAGPTLAEAQANDVMKTVYAKCQSTVWNRTQSGKRGSVQKLLERDNLVLTHGTVWRNDNPVDEGIYVSTHEEIMLREYWGPRLAKLRSLTNSYRDDYEMMKGRVPEAVDATIRAALEAAFVEATAKLPVPTLGSGATNGQKALEK